MLAGLLKDNDILLMQGAGNIGRIAYELTAAWELLQPIEKENHENSAA
jgi:UDP-N-acetylmuramate-alanine ligase